MQIFSSLFLSELSLFLLKIAFFNKNNRLMASEEFEAKRFINQDLNIIVRAGRPVPKPVF